MVELTILGNYGPYAPAKSACSGYLLNVDGFLILLDCGNGSFSMLERYADYRKLNLLILTHLHPDHYSDVYCLHRALQYQMREGERREPLFVYLPDAPSPVAEEIRSWEDVFSAVSLEEARHAVNDFHRFQLRFFPVRHQVPCYGVQFCAGGETVLTYTSDTGWFPGLEEECRGTRTLLAEASLREFEAQRLGDHHLTARQAASCAQNCGARQLILTHFFPESNLHQLRREAEQYFDGRIEMSACGKTYLLQP